MLNHLDEYPVHQTAEPLAHVATGDRNVYDRYWFNGFSRDGEFFFGVAMGLYPNRSVMDAAFSVVHAGRQSSVRASRLAPSERTETVVAPISIEVVKPMRTLRVRVGPNEFGLRADLVFQARTEPIEEPRVTHRSGSRVMMDSTRFTQFGTWEGSFELAGRTVPVDPSRFLGTRDRSWGIRPLGEREAGAPGAPPQFFWLWAPIHFDDHCTHFQVNEDETGRVWHQNGVIVPLLDAAGSAAGAPKRMAAVHHEVDWQKGTRRAERARLTLIPQEGEARRLELEPVLTFQMRGLGYLDPEWGHGVWKGSHVVDGVTWELDELNPLEPWHVHVQQLCRVRSDGQEGLGAFEQLVIGPHAPSGFRDLFDPAE